MIFKDNVSKDRLKQVVVLESRTLEIYWCVNSDHGLVFFDDCNKSDLELSRQKIIELDWYN